jgi:prepilin-type N-terminal cleavage/methylation domain-containing protein
MRRLANEERGFTLIEVLIAASLLTVVLGVALDGLFTLTRSSTKAQVQTFSAEQNRVGMERLTRLLRQAVLPPNTDNPTIVASADKNSMSFYSRLAGSATAGDSNNTVYKYTVTLNTTNNIVTIGRSDCTPDPVTTKCTWPAPSFTSALITNVRNAIAGQRCSNQGGTDNTPLFQYYPQTAATGNLIPITPVPVADISSIVFVRVNLYTQITGAGDQQTCQPLVSQVELRNSNPV